MKTIFNLIFATLSTLTFCQSNFPTYTPNSQYEYLQLWNHSKFYGYKIEDNFIKEVGISDYRQIFNQNWSNITIRPVFILVNHDGVENKRLIITSKVENFERQFDLFMIRDIYTFETFIKFINYGLN